jgi:hypothetical protein
LNARTALILLGSRRLRINWAEERINAVRHQNGVFCGVLKLTPPAKRTNAEPARPPRPGEGGMTTKSMNRAGQSWVEMLWGLAAARPDILSVSNTTSRSTR